MENMNMGGMSPADVKALVSDSGDLGGGGGIWLLVLLVLFGGAGGGFGRNNECCPPLTCQQYHDSENSSALLSGQNQMSLALQNDLNAITASIERSRDTTQNGIFTLNNTVRDGNYNINSAIQQNGFNNQQGFCSVIKAVDDCCCKQELATVNQTNALTNAIRDEGAATRALFNDTRMHDLEAQIAQCNCEKTAQAQADRVLAIQGRYVTNPPCPLPCPCPHPVVG